MKTDILFPRTASRAQRLRYAEALFRIQRRDHRLRSRWQFITRLLANVGRFLAWVATAPFRSQHPAVLLVAMCVVYLASWGLIRRF